MKLVFDGGAVAIHEHQKGQLRVSLCRMLRVAFHRVVRINQSWHLYFKARKFAILTSAERFYDDQYGIVDYWIPLSYLKAFGKFVFQGKLSPLKTHFRRRRQMLDTE